MINARAHEYEDVPRPPEPLAQVGLVLTPPPPPVLEVFLEPYHDRPDHVGRVLRVNDRRSGLPVLTVKLDAEMFMRLLGGQPVEQVAWLLPRPQRDVLGRDRVPLTVRILPEQPRTAEGGDPVAAWVVRAGEHLEPLGIVDYHERGGIDVGAPQETFTRVCTFLLYPPEDVELDAQRRRELRAELSGLARDMGVLLAPGESNEEGVHRDATVRREDDWWVVEVGGYATQAQTPAEVEHMARDMIACLLAVPYDKVSVTVQFVGDDEDRAAWEAGRRTEPI